MLVVDSALLNDGRWPLGRVMKTFKGNDNLVRSAEIKTAEGIYTTPVVKICRLPIPVSTYRSRNEAGGNVGLNK